MRKVLINTFILTLVALAISGIAYTSTTRRIQGEAIIIILTLALIAAVPITMGYIIASASLRSPNIVWTILKFFLFLVNGGLIIGTTILTTAILPEEGAVLVGYPYILAGIYTYYQTIKIIRSPSYIETRALPDDDLLDDCLMDSK